MPHSRVLPIVLLACALAPSGAAQWSSDPATNTAISTAPSDQTQVKLEPIELGGGGYASWFDGIGSGYDVRLQRIGVNGSQLFPIGGVLVADRSFSSTQDYGLDATLSGNALLAFRDDRPGGTQITATLVGFDGSMPWGPLGVQLTSTGDFVAAPKIVRTDEHGAVVAWTQNASVHVQRLSPAGVPQWPADVVLTPVGGTYSVSDLQTDPNGDAAILSFVHQTGGFGSPRRILAQKFDATGALLWGAGHVQVFTSGSLQFGNFPAFVPDSNGGAVFSWYDAGSSQLQCYVQRILTDGSPAFAPGGLAVSTDLSRVRVSPVAIWDGASDEISVAWREQNPAQSMNGIWAQRFDAAGNRLWGPTGSSIQPLGSDELSQVRLAPTNAGSMVFWDRSPAFGQDQLEGVRLDQNGAVATGPFALTTTPSGKSRLASLHQAGGLVVMAWTDDRNDSGDLLVQNVNSNGSLGEVGVTSCFGNACPCGNDDPAGGCANSTGAGAFLAAVGSTSVAVDDLLLNTTRLPAGNSAILFMGDGNALSLPFGDGLRCVGGNTWRWPLSNTGSTASDLASGLVSQSVANHPPAFQLTAGGTWTFQLWYRDPIGPCASGFNLSNSVTLDFLP